MAKLEELLPQGVTFLTDTLGAERAMVVYEGLGTVHGFPSDNVWTTAELSHTVFQTLVEEMEPLVMFDAIEDPRYKNQTSALLSALRSILFVPVQNPVGRPAGFLYADNRQRSGAFEHTHLQTVSTFVEETFRPLLWEAAPDAAGPALDWDHLMRTRWV